MNQKITEPLRLAVGSHSAGSGKGCAMNVISWENGDSTITDLPACADGFLARMVQRVNDSYCTHTKDMLLCPPCSIEVLALGHRTVGTFLEGWTPKQRAMVYVEIAVEQAESILKYTKDDRPRQACALVRRFLAGEVVTRGELMAARSNAAYAAVAYAADAAAYAADAVAYAADAVAYAADAVAYAAYAAAAYAADHAAYAVDAVARSHLRLDRAHKIIDRFEEITGVRSIVTEPETTAEAVVKMLETAR